MRGHGRMLLSRPQVSITFLSKLGGMRTYSE
jgi:hypothetical protein